MAFSAIGSGAMSAAVYEVKGIVYGLAMMLFLRFEPDGLIAAGVTSSTTGPNWVFTF